MPNHRRNEPIKSWQDGDSVQGFALLTRKEARQDRNGRDYFDLAICDQSGSIGAKIWADSRAMQTTAETHDFIAFKGSVKGYRDQLQLTIDECRTAGDEDRSRGFDESKLIPTTRENIEDLWQRLEKTLAGVKRPVLRRLADETLVAHGQGLREHPAAKSIHHAYRGGLLEHVVSMLELADRISSHYPELDRDLMLLGVLFHDLGKLQELGAMPVNEYTLEGRLVGHVVIGYDLLRRRCAAIADFPEDLRLLLEHLVLSHQGRRELGAPVEPMTAEAVALHCVDDLDSKLNQFRAAREGGASLHYVKALNRYIYLPELTTPFGTASSTPPPQ